MILLIWRRLWVLLFILLLFAACLPQAEPSVILNVTTAQIGDSVIASVENLDTTNAKVTVAQIMAEVTSTNASSLTFTIPDLPQEKLGEQEVIISAAEKIAKTKLTLSAKPIVSSFSLAPGEAASGTAVKASLKNLDGTKATVTVGNKLADILDSKVDSLIFKIPAFSNSELGKKEVVIKTPTQSASGELTVVAATFSLNKERAERGETVTASVSGFSFEGASLKIAGNTAEFVVIDPTTFSFIIPKSSPIDTQLVELTTKTFDLSQTIGILGNVDAGKLTLLVKPQTSENALRNQLAKLGFSLESSLKTLGASSGPCSAELANIDVGDTPLGEALEQLKKLEQNGEGITLHVDPRSGWSVGAIDHLNSVNASSAFARGRSGTGTMIAVLDSGISQHTDLGTRFRTDLSYDFIDDDAIPEDNFDDPSSLGAPAEGHGTPIAILAAGEFSGVAPKAEVMGVKVCDDNGLCLSSNVILGICHALTKAPSMDKLVVNLSLGGDTPIQALEAILKYALDNNVLVAAAGGNEGETGSPTHYPAAFPLDGLVAVGALQTTDLACIDFEDQKLASTFGYGEGFSSQGTGLLVEPYHFVGGKVSPRGQVAITDINEDTSLETQFSNANLAFSFSKTIGGLELDYLIDGNINLSINQKLGAVPQYIGSLADLNSQVIAGVSVIVDSKAGKIRLSGKIDHIAIGSEYLVLDNVCPIIGAEADWSPAPFSTRGSYIDISAPGVGLTSGTPLANSYFQGYEGTSFATPLVAGALALYREANPTASPAEIEKMLKESATPLAFDVNAVGVGMLNLATKP